MRSRSSGLGPSPSSMLRFEFGGLVFGRSLLLLQVLLEFLQEVAELLLDFPGLFG